MTKLFKQENEKETTIERLKSLTLKLVCTGIFYLHSQLSVFQFWQIDNSRPVRFTLNFINIIFTTAVQSLTSSVNFFIFFYKNYILSIIFQALSLLANTIFGIILGIVGTLVQRSLQALL